MAARLSAVDQTAAGVLVVAELTDASESFSATTDSEGRFAFSSIPLGDYAIYVSGRKSGTGESVSLSLDEPTQGVVLDLSNTSVLSGTVLSGDGLPFANGDISVERNGVVVANSTTSTNGEFAFLISETGRYRVSVNPNVQGFFLPQEVEFAVGADVHVAFTAGDLTLRVSNTSAETINRVTLSHLNQGKAIAGLSSDTFTDSSFEFSGLIAGTYRLSIVTESGTHDRLVSVPAISSVEYSTLDSQLVSIRGSIDSEDVSGSQAAFVQISTADGSIKPRQILVKNDGTFHVLVSPRDSLTIRFIVPGKVAVERIVAATDNLDIGLTVTETASGMVVGAIDLSTYDGARPPIAVLISAGVAIATAEVRADGSFEFSDVEGSDFALAFLFDGNESATLVVGDVSGGQVVDVGLVIANAAVVRLSEQAFGSASQEVSDAQTVSFDNAKTIALSGLGEGESLFSRFVPNFLVPFLNSNKTLDPNEVKFVLQSPDGCDCGPLESQLLKAKVKQDSASTTMFEFEALMKENAGYFLLTFLSDLGQASYHTGIALFKARNLPKSAKGITEAIQDLVISQGIDDGFDSPISPLNTPEFKGALKTLAGIDDRIGQYRELFGELRSAESVPELVEKIAEAFEAGISVLADLFLAIQVLQQATGGSIEGFGPARTVIARIEVIADIVSDVAVAFQKAQVKTARGSLNSMLDAREVMERAEVSYKQAVFEANSAQNMLQRCIERWLAEQDDDQPDPNPEPDPNPDPNDPDPPRPPRKPQPLDPDTLEPEPGDDDDPNDDDEPGSGEPGNGEGPNGGSPIRRNPVLRFFNSDPNDILGPDGFGDQRWVSESENLNYRIRFENDPLAANAPVQVLRITQTVDSDLDVRSFRLGDFGIGEMVFSVPANTAAYSQRFDLVEEQGIFIDVVAGIDIQSRQLFWEMTAIDPETGLRPFDPLLGFLPPNITPPEGDGFVTYSIRPSRTAKTGDIIDAEARIFFDGNEPVDTPPIFNTIDAVLPTSDVAELPSLSTETTFEVAWSGTDDEEGSAVGTYDVFVSIDGTTYQKWIERTDLTTAQYVGELGHTYSFYTVARDNAGNFEAVPEAAERNNFHARRSRRHRTEDRQCDLAARTATAFLCGHSDVHVRRGNQSGSVHHRRFHHRRGHIDQSRHQRRRGRRQHCPTQCRSVPLYVR